ncbi:hypothetical protein GGR56DRAFT_649156 [Xylariaceae sp. FL0804]|nr:hypothetical protein GGR56DRAFT_649156 [Xylariaceae sp. FL0804]
MGTNINYWSGTQHALGTSPDYDQLDSPEPKWAGMLRLTKDTPARHPGSCQLCARPTEKITKHHLYPRKTQHEGSISAEKAESIILLCWPCHVIIHRIISHEYLANFYNSIEALLHHQGIRDWLTWSWTQTIYDLHVLMIPRESKPKSQVALNGQPSSFVEV